MLSQNFISAIDLEESSKIRRSAQVEHERKVAIFDLLEENSFTLRGGPDGPYHLRIQIKENRLIFNLNSNDDTFLLDISLAVAIFRKIVKDYFLI